MQNHDILVIGASAGGVEALKQLVQALPKDIPATIFVVVHIPAKSRSRLPEILNRFGTLKAFHPKDGDKITQGCIYVAPPDYHLIIKNGYVRIAKGPKENNTRPAIDVLFRTAARVYGPRVVAVVLSGTLDDGTAGLIAVEQRGGITMVQNPEEAMFDGMPKNAIENDHVKYILNIAEIAPVLMKLANQPIQTEEVEAVSDEMEMETDMAELELEAMQSNTRPGTPSPFACPECGGVLWEIVDDKLVRYRCRTGHAFSPHTLINSQSEQLEEAFWTALRALEEKAALTVKMAQQAQKNNRPYSAQRFQQQSQDASQRASLVRQLLLRDEGNENLSTINNELIMNGNGQIEWSEDELVEDKTNNSLNSNKKPNFQVIALCASAGGIRALAEILSDLKADFPAAITIVQHIARQYPSQLANILSRSTELKVKQAESGDILAPGNVYIAPPDQHLLVNPDQTLSLSHAELVNFLRPSGDLLLESLAASFKEQAIAVILTGTGSDGAMGIQAIKKMNGFVIAQDKTTAEHYGMPKAAINTECVDQIVPLHEIATLLVNLVTKYQPT
ncbi:chemotaxis protein CheB [Aphanothece hegewaldii CCALA 016]|uniref:protein-glutamate methylesterase n=1 Tax=Aphanothece hegewaldii CCALA 016 TaxID=2107694 RepID=A0A2T1LZJ8_9CHRO|nr:chemotaxis protein CheB [Aphanothece hegewaldii]PSF37849.1 chemotaxis protein CheB [Aphanothece hegewaldii CCALA 016]